MFPAVMVVCTVLLIQTERDGRGMQKMLSLPVNRSWLCLAKFILLAVLAAILMLLMTAGYYVSAVVAGGLQGYDFLLSISYVLPIVVRLFLASIPMLTFFWMLAVCIVAPVFSVGAALASIVPSVLMLNTEYWFLYPMSYPFYLIMEEQARLTGQAVEMESVLLPWGLTAAAVTILCLLVSCLCFGREERR